MLIGQAGSLGRKTRQEVELEQGEREYSGPAQTTEEATCELTAEKGTNPYS